jgi:hypothetical protein
MGSCVSMKNNKVKDIHDTENYSRVDVKLVNFCSDEGIEQKLKDVESIFRYSFGFAPLLKIQRSDLFRRRKTRSEVNCK